jgi:threonine/homoserine/homoserine lactone efflux protein
MPLIDTLIAFLFAALLFAAMPGPAILRAAVRTPAQGRAAHWVNRTGGALMVGLGLRFATDRT